MGMGYFIEIFWGKFIELYLWGPVVDFFSIGTLNLSNLVNIRDSLILDTDLVWRMQLMVKNSGCVFREILTYNAYYLNSSYQI